jgi:predicted N-formylglutamate amidohydrolase
MTASRHLLAADEPDPVNLHNMDGGSPLFLVCEHAGRRIPEKLGDLGLDEAERARHIAWDIGAEGVSLQLASILDAPLITQTYSRLVCDCNRATHVPSFIPLISESTVIPGNAGLGDSERSARIDEIYLPLHDRITAEIDRRLAAGQPVVFISMHSFTPVFMSDTRPMHVGLLYDRDPRLGHLVGSALRSSASHEIADNEPYALDHGRDFTVPEHGERRGLPSLEVELRQDLITMPEGQAEWAERLAAPLRPALDHLLREL